MADRMRRNGKCKMKNAKWAFFLCLQYPVYCFSEDLPDPTRPSMLIDIPVAASGVADSPSIGLQSIIISSKRRAAIINGETVELGNKQGDARLIEVNEGNVVLQDAQGRQVLSLFPDVKIEHVKLKLPVSRVWAGKKKPVAHDEKFGHRKEED
jgi:hypothetical protein